MMALSFEIYPGNETAAHTIGANGGTKVENS
jgi:hypothetical protein